MSLKKEKKEKERRKVRTKKEKRKEREKTFHPLSASSSLPLSLPLSAFRSLSLSPPISLSPTPSRLVPARVAPPARLLELPPLAAHERLRRGAGDAGRRAKVLAGLARRRLAAEQDAVAARRRRQGELVEGEDLAARGDDAGARALGHAQRGHAQLRDGEESGVVRHGADDGGRLAVLALHELGELGQRERGAVGLRHVEAAEDDGIELGVSAAREELVELLRVFFSPRRDVEVGE